MDRVLDFFLNVYLFNNTEVIYLQRNNISVLLSTKVLYSAVPMLWPLNMMMTTGVHDNHGYKLSFHKNSSDHILLDDKQLNMFR
jgi:hypothetical protein